MENGARPAKSKDRYLKSVLFGSFGLGMAVALAVYFAWRLHAIPAEYYGLFSAVALSICPPFVLSFIIGPAPDSGLELGLVVGTIVLANAFLYAGVAAGVYAAMVAMMRRGRKRAAEGGKGK
ncbi:MAG: hypothetical protein WCC87_00065 [Candidatus Korobacteraceae bacterium]